MIVATAAGGAAWRRRWYPRLAPVAGVAAFLLLWQGLVAGGVLPPSLVPPPSVIPGTFYRELASGIWAKVVAESLGHYLIGVGAGSLFGIAFGVVVGLSPRIEAAQEGIARLLRPIPPLAWIPFALIWFGVSETAAAFIIAITVFWLNYFATLGAVKMVDPGYLELARAFGHGALLDRLLKIVLPAASPGIVSGLRAGLGQGWMAVVAAELFGIPGIGQRMMDAAGLLATNIVVLYMLTIAVLYGLSDWLFQIVSRRILAWTY